MATLEAYDGPWHGDRFLASADGMNTINIGNIITE